MESILIDIEQKVAEIRTWSELLRADKISEKEYDEQVDILKGELIKLAEGI